MIFTPIAITTSTPLVLNLLKFQDLDSGPCQLAVLEIYNQTSGADVYFGDTPPAAFTLTGLKPTASSKDVSFHDTVTGQLHSKRHRVIAGMTVTDSEAQIAAGSQVLQVENTKFSMGVAADGGSLTDLTFTAPAIASTNGIPIAQGGLRIWETSINNKFLNTSLTFVVASGTATLRIRYQTY